MADKEFDRNQILFLSLIQSLASSAWIQLGKQLNPVTRKAECNLQEAALTIDIIEMLHSKTAGNRNENESRIMEKMLSDLKTNFIEMKIKSPKNSEQGNPEAEQNTPNKS